MSYGKPAADPLPNEKERKDLCDILFEAFVEIRIAAGSGHGGVDAVQAHDLAYAIHNLPKTMYGWGTWSVAGQRAMLQHYQTKYPGGTDFVALFDAVFAGRGIGFEPGHP